MKKEKLLKVSVTGVFCALAFILTIVLRFNVAFLSFDLKDAILAVISLLYGPLYGVLSAAVVVVLEFLSISDTGIYGLIMNFISSAAFTLVCGFIYKYNRTLKGAVLSVTFSVISVCVFMCLANIIITPYYMGVTRSEIILLIPTLLLPFNLCKSLVNAAVTVIIHKPISNILKKNGIIKTNNTSDKKSYSKNIVICIIGILAIIIAIVFMISKLGGNISFL